MKKAEIIRLSIAGMLSLFAFIVAFFAPSEQSLMGYFPSLFGILIHCSPYQLELFLGLSVVVVSLLFLLAGIVTMIQKKDWLFSIAIGVYLFISFVMLVYVPLFDDVRPYLDEGKEILSIFALTFALISWIMGMYEIGIRLEIEPKLHFSENKIEFLNKKTKKEVENVVEKSENIRKDS